MAPSGRPRLLLRSDYQCVIAKDAIAPVMSFCITKKEFGTIVTANDREECSAPGQVNNCCNDKNEQARAKQNQQDSDNPEQNLVRGAVNLRFTILEKR